MTVRVEHGDCLAVLPTLAADSVHSCVTDPPYHLSSIVKRFGAENAAPAKGNPVYQRSSKGFMGKQWDGGDIAFRLETWAEVYRVLRPGAHLIAFSGTRTYHRMACAIEDAGFEIRDQIGWLYGSGFPKSHNVSKAIDRAAGAEREVTGTRTAHDIRSGNLMEASQGHGRGTMEYAYTAAATEAARQWQGWGTALKPAWEPIVLARKPLIGTVAANVQQHGTGALNIDGCRVACEDKTPFPVGATSIDGVITTGLHSKPRGDDANHTGRWPANIIHDGSEEVIEAFPETHSAGSERPHTPGGTYDGTTGIGFGGVGVGQKGFRIGDDGGSAARFFYTAKADAQDRLQSKHPTVKPVDLMAYLCRLVTPPGGLVLDPFAGSGTIGMACMREGFDCILIEREAEYVADIGRRLAHVRGEDAPLFAKPYDPEANSKGCYDLAINELRNR